MPTNADALEKVLAFVGEHLNGYPFLPPKPESTFDVFKAFLFEYKEKIPKPTFSGLKDCLNKLPQEEQAKFNPMATLLDVKSGDIIDSTGPHLSKHSLGVAASIGGGEGNVGLGRKIEVTYDIKLTDVKRFYQKSVPDLTEFIGSNAKAYAMADPVVWSKLTTDIGIEGGFSDVVVGFAYQKHTALQHHLNLGAKGNLELGGGAGAGDNDLTVGLCSMDDKKRSVGKMEGVVTLNFLVVHLRRLNAGSEDLTLERMPFQVNGLNEDELLIAFRRTQAALKKVKRSNQKNQRAYLFRCFGGGPNQVEEEEPEHHEGIETNDDDNDDIYSHMALADDDEEGQPLLDAHRFNSDSTKERYSGSWNFRIEGTKERMTKLADAVKKGPTQFEGLMITKMTRASCVDVSAFLPIYYNSEKHISNVKVPSHVLCYDTGIPDHWCLRPVDHGGERNYHVVTMSSREWKVRESVVRVREADKDFQAKLERIGFHVLEDEYDAGLVEAAPEKGPFLVMGRDELTPFHEIGTTLEGIEYCQGFVCENENHAGRASVPEATIRPTDPLQVLPQTRAVTNSMPGSPEHKKRKST